MQQIKYFESCIAELSKLPSIGRKTATRLALHILKMKPEMAKRLALSIVELKEKTMFCEICGSLSEGITCSICLSKSRVRDIICVVEEAKDVLVIENTAHYNGLYHVLGGKISPLDGVAPSDLTFDKLIKRVRDDKVNELIIATNPDADGETTAIYIARLLKDIPDLKITKLASGIPIGSLIEYADDLTVMRALENRNIVKE